MKDKPADRIRRGLEEALEYAKQESRKENPKPAVAKYRKTVKELPDDPGSQD